MDALDGVEPHCKGNQTFIMSAWRLPRRAVGWGMRRLRGLMGNADVAAVAPGSVTAGKPAVDPPSTSDCFDDAMTASGGFGTWRQQRRGECLQFIESNVGRLDLLHKYTPGEIDACLMRADELLVHHFSFLGSGQFKPVDADRPALGGGYQPIDWCLDPVRGLRFRSDVPQESWDLFAMRPANADIKYPWELGRCQHFVVLAQAYCLSGDERYASEIINQCADFMSANPVGLGIQWVCTMDVALRAANWCFALSLLKDCPSIEEELWERIYRHLFKTGCFILQNLENNYEVTSNHFLSNLIGLHVLAAEFSGLEFATDWDAYARKAIEVEIGAQILDDGADYESSVPYHRLVCELFLGSMRLAQIQGNPFSGNFHARLNSMLTFMEAVLHPDGTMPVVGDADDGRLLTISDNSSPADARHILASGGAVLGRPDLVLRAGDIAFWESFWWGFVPSDFIHQGGSEPTAEVTDCSLFEDAGIAVGRNQHRGNYLLVSNGSVGTSGFGNHKHNDLLSFEYIDMGQQLIVDPGSYVYTSDFDARNTFRSTRRHSTVMIDGVEQNEINEEYLFRVFAKATPAHKTFERMPSGIRYVGSHDGYVSQLEEGVVHERHFEQNSRSGILTIEDHLSGAGVHVVDWFWQIAPGVDVAAMEVERYVTLQAGEMKWRFSWLDAQFALEVLEVEVSPSYGVKRPSLALRHTGTIDVTSSYKTSFKITREMTG